MNCDVQGMQVNPGVRTIEAEMHKALVEAQAISTCGETKMSKTSTKDTVTDDFRTCKWGRAARTDKGVSAAGQVVAFNMTLKPDMAARLNAVLPDQILVYGFKCALCPLSACAQQTGNRKTGSASQGILYEARKPVYFSCY